MKGTIQIPRRVFMGTCAFALASLGISRFADIAEAEAASASEWLTRREDPVRKRVSGIAYHQAEGHLTAYEQVSFPPGERVADYCLPCQLVAARAARLLVS